MFPPSSTISTHSTISPMDRPYAPAFPGSAPPTVPGIPPSSSAPEREDRAHRTANLGSITPASAIITPPGAKRTFPLFFFGQIPAPRMPPSDTRRLLPAPSALPSRFAPRSAARTSWTSFPECGKTIRSAGPPIPTVVNSRILAPNTSSTLPIIPPRRPCLSRPSGGYHALCQFPDIPGPHGQKYVARLQPGGNPPCGFPCLPREKDRLVPVVPYRLAEPLARGPRGRVLPRGGALENEEQVRIVERGGELLEKGVRPGIPVRLEADDDPAGGRPLPGGGKRRADLRGVMPVIVHDRHALPLSLDLEPPVHSPVVGQPLPDLVEGDPQLRSDRHRGKRVAHVVAAGGGKQDLAEDLAAADHPEAVRHPLGRNSVGPVIRPRGGAGGG